MNFEKDFDKMVDHIIGKANDATKVAKKYGESIIDNANTGKTAITTEFFSKLFARMLTTNLERNNVGAECGYTFKNGNLMTIDMPSYKNHYNIDLWHTKNDNEKINVIDTYQVFIEDVDEKFTLNLIAVLYNDGDMDISDLDMTVHPDTINRVTGIIRGIYYFLIDNKERLHQLSEAVIVPSVLYWVGYSTVHGANDDYRAIVYYVDKNETRTFSAQTVLFDDANKALMYYENLYRSKLGYDVDTVIYPIRTKNFKDLKFFQHTGNDGEWWSPNFNFEWTNSHPLFNN